MSRQDRKFSFHKISNLKRDKVFRILCEFDFRWKKKRKRKIDKPMLSSVDTKTS
jgi:hypothetical protein